MVGGTKELWLRNRATRGWSQRPGDVDKPSPDTLINDGPMDPVIMKFKHLIDLEGSVSGG